MQKHNQDESGVWKARTWGNLILDRSSSSVLTEFLSLAHTKGEIHTPEGD